MMARMTWFGALIGLSLLASPASHAREVSRVISLDWGLTSTLLALGEPVTAIAEKPTYRDWVGDPGSPVADLGLRLAPNMERLHAIQPDLILISPQFSSIEPRLRSIAPVRTFATFTPDKRPLENATRITLELGNLLDRRDEAQRLMDGVAAAIDVLRETVHPGKFTCPVLVVNFVDDRHVRIFGVGSLYNDVLKAAGIRNGWDRSTNFWGFSITPISALLRYPDTALIVVEPMPFGVKRLLDGQRSADRAGSLLGNLPAVAQMRYRVVPPIWSFGGLPEAAHFARQLAANPLPECRHE